MAELWQYHDGGRFAAGYKGQTGDCATRAIAIASGLPYQQVYDRINELAKSERVGTRKRGVSNARTGVYPTTMKRLLAELGATWAPTMKFGEGCRVHVRVDELPTTGRHILNLSRHYAAWIDGQVFDLYDPSRDGTRCVYGYWTLPT